MGWQTTLLQLSPLIINLSKIAEKAFEHKPKSGVEKKQFVHQATKDILAGAGQVTTGGAHDTFEVIDKVAPSLIDVIAGFLFSKHKQKPSVNELPIEKSNKYIPNDYVNVLLKEECKQKPFTDEMPVEKNKEHIFNANHADILLK